MSDADKPVTRRRRATPCFVAVRVSNDTDTLKILKAPFADPVAASDWLEENFEQYEKLGDTFVVGRIVESRSVVMKKSLSRDAAKAYAQEADDGTEDDSFEAPTAAEDAAPEEAPEGTPEEAPEAPPEEAPAAPKPPPPPQAPKQAPPVAPAAPKPPPGPPPPRPPGPPPPKPAAAPPAAAPKPPPPPPAPVAPKPPAPKGPPAPPPPPPPPDSASDGVGDDELSLM